MKTFALRLKPEADLRQALLQFAQMRPLRAGFVLSAVGSLHQACLRFAGAATGTILTGKFELIALTGTLCPTGVHLHGAIADATGQTRGGHLLTGCLVYTTCELVLGEAMGWEFRRELDPETGFHELIPQPSATESSSKLP
ncbi:PPC domain-containing DNA-binding protein [Candidatus Cyanaurora vandensis]|uniref:PPC domain-containing DNA-binding protein n=1 Tax=Candidatus Cyanaurora vandensis TaxID=2714958 RepID=UPI00257A1963|nr:PPC domain-containing DNA-binding protein [Candidatus Cyanaurora vandensis]